MIISTSEEQVRAKARQEYETGSANFTIDRSKCALIVIDMQESFVTPGRSPYWVPAATGQISTLGKLIERCRRQKVPIIYTAFGHTHHRLDRPHSLSLMPLGKPLEHHPQTTADERDPICDALSPEPEDVVIYKPSYGAFIDTPLETILKNLNKDTVIISGTLTNFCCGATARQAFERGFKVVFGSDVNATDLPEMHENELKVLRRGFAKVLNAQEIIEALENTP